MSQNMTQNASQMLAFLQRRRSVLARNMVAPGPDPQQLRDMLSAAARVPDHGKLAPWRFVILDDAAAVRLGALAHDRLRATDPDATPDRLAQETQRFQRAPCVIAVVSSPVDHPKIPANEQLLSAGAVCMTLLVAGQSLGFAGQWLTEWVSYDVDIQRALGLDAREAIAGFLYFGTAHTPPDERARPALDEIVTYGLPSANIGPNA